MPSTAEACSETYYTLKFIVTGQIVQYGSIISYCTGRVTGQPSALVTVETVTLGIEWTFFSRLRRDGSLIWAETALRNGVAQTYEL